MSILVRLKLKSFNPDLFFTTIHTLKININTISKKSIYINLPICRKSFCILRSPHIDKDTREHLSIIKYSGFFDIIILNLDNIIPILKKNVPFGIFYQLSIKKANIV